jgi:hypothetical protein
MLIPLAPKTLDKNMFMIYKTPRLESQAETRGVHDIKNSLGGSDTVAS